MRTLFVAALLMLTLSAVVAPRAHSRAHAQTPPESTPVPEPTPELSLRFDDHDTFSWNAIEGALSYTVQGNVFVVRTNAADPICTPPLVEESRSINVTAFVANGATSYRLELPVLQPEDRWFVASYSISLVALGAEQTQALASTLIGGVAETLCAAPAVPTPLPSAIVVRGCEIPAGYREVTTPAAVERGQRVFESPEHVTRIYVRADGACIRLYGAAHPVPEFAPEGDLGVPNAASDGLPANAITLPDTGAGPSSSSLVTLIALLAMLGSGALLGGAISARRRAR